MKRRALHIMVLLLLFIAGGAIVNVAVAWGCIVATVTLPYSSNDVRDENEWWHSRAPSGLEFTSRQGYRHSTFGMTYRFMSNIPNVAPRDPIFIYASFLSAGWPLRTLDGSHWLYYFARVTPTEWQTKDRSILRTFGELRNPNLFLPTNLIWVGFAINTIFYAAILWLLFCAPGKVRRSNRIRKGKCPTCGFIIAPGTCANGLCSECGATLPASLSHRAGEPNAHSG